MKKSTLSRRELLIGGGATLATMALFNSRFAQAAPLMQGDVRHPLAGSTGGEPGAGGD